MSEILETIFKLIPLVDFFHSLGVNEEISIFLASLINLFIIWVVTRFSIFINKRYRKYKLEEDLRPQFDPVSIRKNNKFYIKTQFQNASPTRMEEPRHTHSFVAKGKLIPFFLKVFKAKYLTERFYIILADSGMGKTTFMINLYMRVISFWNFRRGKKLKIKLLRLGSEDSLSIVKAIEGIDMQDTVLLLDALDEDPFIISKSNEISDEEAFHNRVSEIIRVTKKFKHVIITCRTQYFPGQEDDPYELSVQRPDEKGFYKLNKIYISPFDDIEVKHYLNKKFPFWKIWNKEKKNRAIKIVKNSPNLVVRPMLLNYIELLVEDGDMYNTTYSIYNTLIEKWLIRESEKRKYLSSERSAFITNLRDVSEQTALTIYEQRKLLRGLFINKVQIISIAKDHNIELKPNELTGQSLLTCDGQGNWKFAHRSILEFFLARKAINDISFFHIINMTGFAGMDMTKLFYEEMGEWVFVNGGEFQIGDEQKDLLRSYIMLKKVSVNSFYIGKTQVTQKFWFEIMNENPSFFKGVNNRPVEQVSWNDINVFLSRLNAKTGKEYRLPTEAEWEYAARGGDKQTGYLYSGSNNIEEVGWYQKNSEDITHTVKQKQPNELGIYDMSGNVWEWVQDSWEESYQTLPIDGKAWEEKDNSLYTYRGGCYFDREKGCRVANRDRANADFRGKFLGFRLALSV